MRKKIIAGNWKMNLSSEEATELISQYARIAQSSEVNLMVFPPMIYLKDCIKAVTNIGVGAQNGFPIDSGAFTGEVSMKQIKMAGANAVLIGHSERRSLFHESDAFLKQKIDAALESGLIPFFCCGESLEVRNSNEHIAFVQNQLHTVLGHLSDDQMSQIVIAYEPIWAIGTGLTASSAQAEEMHSSIRNWIKTQFNSSISDNCSILYGGSCNPSNAAELFACPNVDGGLIGGASLKSTDFEQLFSAEAWITLN